MKLNHATCANEAPGEKLKKISDGNGLQLWITPEGRRYWRFSYRFGGKQKALSLGVFPQVSLKAARNSRDEARAMLVAGTDPCETRKAAKAKRELGANTFSEVSAAFLAEQAQRDISEPTLEKLRWIVGMANVKLGSNAMDKISALEVLDVLKQVERQEHFETAARMRSTLSRVFRFAALRNLCHSDPTQVLKGALVSRKPKHHAAIVEPKGLGGLLRAIDGFEGQPTTRIALKLMAYLFPRPGELRAAHWDEFDIEARVWNVPGERMKMRRPHQVPLSQQSVALLRELREFTGGGKLILPSVRTTAKPISENTTNAALRRLGYSKNEVTSHGFRATASTLLNESRKWSADAIERQLAHVEQSKSRSPYLRADFWDERVTMMQWWANQLDSWQTNGQVHNLFPAAPATISAP